MKRAILVALATGAVVSSAAALSIGAATGTTEDSILTRTQLEAGLRALEGVREAVQLACDAHVGGEREVCRAEAAATELVAAAELERRYRRTDHSERVAQRARIDARYLVDRARCSAQSGARRDRCLIQAHANKGRALLEAAAPYEVRL